MRMHEAIEIFCVDVGNFAFLTVVLQYRRQNRPGNKCYSFIHFIYFFQDKRILRSYGYSLKGQRAKVKRRYSLWGPRITAIPIISHGEGLLDVGLYEGHVNGETFLDFVNSVLTPCLLPFNGYNPRSIVILSKVHFLADFPIRTYCPPMTYHPTIQRP